jgi:transposase-like protein
MPRRKVKLDIKVATMREGLQLVNVADIAREYGVTEQSVYNWYNRVLEALPDILTDDKPGRKPKSTAELPPPF